MKGSFTALLRVEGSDPDHLEAQLDRVMEELVRLGVEDPAIGGTLTTGEVEISITVDAESLDEAVPKAISTLRTAIHAAEVSTPGWPGFGPHAAGPLRVDWEKLTLVPA
jgi:hypothetical protein